MTTKDEALNDLLFYIELYRDGNALPPEIESALEKYEACRAALAEQDSEPVAWRFTFNNGVVSTVYSAEEAADTRRYLEEDECEDVFYAKPQPAPAVQQGEQITEEQRRALIAYGDARESKDPSRIAETFAAALYTTPQPAPVVQPLTPKQVQGLKESAGYEKASELEQTAFWSGVRYGEAAHGIGAPKEPQRDATDPDIQTITLQAGGRDA